MENPAKEPQQLTAQQKREKLAEILKARSSQPSEYPLSIGQERIYKLARLNPDTPLYNVSVAYRLEGLLNPGQLEDAVRRIRERHEILRTTFPVSHGNPVQRISPVQSQADIFEFFDLDNEPVPNHAQHAEEIISGEVTRIFDLTYGPLWRVALVRVSEVQYFLALTMHHIVSDGWSFEIFLKELRAFYEAAEEERPQVLKPLAQQYAGYARQQRRFFDDRDFEVQRDYWRGQLAGTIPPLHLPQERSSSTYGDRTASSCPFDLSQELSQSLLDLGQKESASLFMTMLAAFGALLHNSTGQQDLLLCTPVTGRHRAQSKDVIGYFNNILPMRLDMSGDPGLSELVRRTRQVALDAFRNQDVPFQWNADLPSLRCITLSRLLFSVDMEWPPKFELSGLRCDPVSVDTGAADFDLSISLWMSDGCILGNVRFKQALFDKAAIIKLSEAYREMLQILVAEPQRQVSTLAELFPALESTANSQVAGEAAEEGAGTPDLPRTAIELRLAKEWEDVFRQRVGIRDTLQSLRASSLAVATLAERIQRDFNTDLPVTAIFQAGTIERMAVMLQAADKSLLTSPLAPIQPNGNRPPLFLCEGVGIYYPLVPYLGDDQPLYGLVSEMTTDYPGIKELASHYVDAVLEVRPEGPYHLGGISFGGLVAFEMAQQLIKKGHEVGVLALMDTPGPDAYHPYPPLRRFLGHFRNLVRFGYPYLQTKLENLFPGRVPVPRNTTGAEVGQTSQLVGDVGELRGMFRKRAKNYHIQPYPGQIRLFTLSQRNGMSDGLFDPALGAIDPDLGWCAVARDGVERYELEGEHVSILREPFVRVLGEQLRQCLNGYESS